MYEIRKGSVSINDVKVHTFHTSVEAPKAIVEAQAGTTGVSGGDTREGGGRTYVSFFCNRGDFLIRPVISDRDEIRGVEICACGDDALDVLVRALGFARRALNDQIMDSLS